MSEQPNWLLSAALSWEFSPDALPGGRPKEEELRRYGRERRRLGEYTGRWFLPDSRRVKILQGAGLDALRDTVAQGTDPASPEDPPAPSEPHETLLARLLTDPVADLSEWTLEELRAGPKVVRWLSGLAYELGDALPRMDEVARIYEREVLVAPLRQRTRRFVGREDERADLGEFAAGAETPDGFFLVIGVGGTGKTTLLAQVAVDRLDAGQPVVWLDLDRPELNLSASRRSEGWRGARDRRGMAIAAEIARQIVALAPDAHASWRTLALQRAEEWRKGADFVGGLADILFRVCHGDPVAVFVDTFEEAQFRRDEGAERVVIGALELLTKAYPGLRVILGGRAPSRHHRGPTLTLGALRLPFARELLAAVARREVDAHVKNVVRRIGGNPLWLVIAGEAMARGVDDIGDLHGRAATAFLYRRILGHLHTLPLEELLLPGLALRTLTPNAVCTVLGNEVEATVTLEEAREHLAGLQREVALVTGAADRIRHRPEVRALTLEGLLHDDPARWTRLHEAAATFWAASDDEEAEAEALYHRLATWDGEGELPWHSSWRKAFADTLDERSTLPAVSVRFLEEKGLGAAMGHSLPEVGSLPDARELAEEERWSEVLEVLGADEDALNAEGLLLLARARREMGAEGSMETAIRAIARAVEDDDGAAMHEADLTVARWEIAEGDTPGAVRALGDALKRTEAPMRRLRLLDIQADIVNDTASLVRSAISAVEGLGAEALAEDPVLLRRLVRWFPDDELVLVAVRLVGIGEASSSLRYRLVEALERWGSDELAEAAAYAVAAEVPLRDLLGQHFAEDLQPLLSELVPNADGEVDWNAAPPERAAAVTRVLVSHGMTGEELRQDLLHRRPGLAGRVNAVWADSALLQNPGTLVRTLEDLRARQGALPADVNAILRQIVQEGERQDPGLRQRIADVLEKVLPTVRHRRRYAEKIALPDPERASRDVFRLVAAADTTGALERLVEAVIAGEPSFGPRLERTWGEALMASIEVGSSSAGRRLVRLVQRVVSEDRPLPLEMGRALTVLGVFRRLDGLAALEDTLPPLTPTDPSLEARLRARERLGRPDRTEALLADGAHAPTVFRIRAERALRGTEGPISAPPLSDATPDALLQAAITQSDRPGTFPGPRAPATPSGRVLRVRQAISAGDEAAAAEALDGFLVTFPLAADRLLLLEDLIQLHKLPRGDLGASLLDQLLESINDLGLTPLLSMPARPVFQER